MSGPPVLTDGDQELETRFAHLLNPIRDLAKNWDVDIASCLEDYLSELEGVTITFDGGNTMNFVQAALVIQGSTSVYSRKVEFLYNLVHDMLQRLAKKKQQNTSVGHDKDASSLEKEAVDDFLTLDDIGTNKNVDLKDTGNTKKKASLLTKTPAFFVPLDDSEKGEMLFSPRGEQIGNKNDFKLGLALMHPSGMLRLEADSERCSRMTGKITPSIPHDSQPIITDDDSRPPSPAVSIHSDGGNDIDLPIDVPENRLNENENKNMDNKIDSDSARYNLRMRKKKDILHERNRMEPADPYEDTKKQDRPFKKGNVIRVLDELEPKVAKKRKMKKLNQKSIEPLTKLASFCSVEYLSDRSKFVKKTLKIPTFAELNRLYWQEQKERQKTMASLKEIAPTDIIPTEDHSDIDEGICDDYMGGGDCGSDSPDPIQPMETKHEEPIGPKEIDKLVACTYEDLVQNHVDNYMSSAQKYGHVTELAKRVQEWEERILPLLDQEEEMEPFDIHEYGTKVLNKFSANNRKQTLPFRKIVEKQDKRQIARYFLASLQLANSYNVAISTPDCELESCINTMELTLLSRVRHHEQLDDYVAPSLQAS